MAVNGELLTHPGQELTPQDFAIMMERISVIRSGILSGCKVTFSETSSTTLNVEEGYVFVRGRLVKVDAGTLSTSGLSTSAATWFVYARVHIDALDVTPSDICTIYATDTVPSDATTDFNENNTGIAYATIATITVANPVTDSVINQSVTPEIGVVKTFTINTSDWVTRSSSNYEIKVCDLSDPRFSETAHIEIVPKTIGYDYGYLKTLQSANIQPFSIGEGVLTLGCYGVVPDVSLEIGIIFRGAL